MTENIRIADELMFIGVDFNQKATILNNDYISGLQPAARKRITSSLIVLARDQLVNNYNQTPSGKKVEISQDKAFEKLAIGIRLLKGLDSNFSVLVYFGKKVDPNYTVQEGLLTSLKILEQIEKLT